ncbi:class II aldolase/adducin family protein [Candidatus Woesearchaeota archaeon]|nr:class II aldolase/adducin family protein [Candidatus Woesearchaeota archaeon]
MAEGVIKYDQIYLETKPQDSNVVDDIIDLRQKCYYLGLIGQDKNRYGGYGFGNVSMRLTAKFYTYPELNSAFFITGTQTGGLEKLTNEHIATIINCNPKTNTVISTGPIKASSESLTHDAVYRCDPSINYIIHAHSPEIFKRQAELPCTNKSVEYGTPEMALEVKRLFLETNVKTKGIFIMLGHEDGVFCFGNTKMTALTNMIFWYHTHSEK